VTGLRAGIVGLGTMGRCHLRVLRELPGVELAGAADPSPLSRSTAGIPAVASVEELLAIGIDICVVAAPTFAHAAIGLRLAAAGVHALIEKPVASDVPSGLLLAEAFESRNLVGCVGHIERYNPATLAMRARILQGELGTVFQVATRRQGPFPERIRDVGVVMDLAVHDVDLTSWIADSSYHNVCAVTASPGGRRYEDLAAVSGMLRNGVVTSHLANWLSPVKDRVVTVTGTGGSMTADTVTGELWLHQGSGQVAASAVGAGGIRCLVLSREPLRAELENFRDAVLGRPARTVTIRQGVAAVAVVEAVMTASRTGVAVQPVVVTGTGHCPPDADTAPFVLANLVPLPLSRDTASGLAARRTARADMVAG
jgi:UDP-N-acetylglucosamine 3-dehydrogenase